MVHSISFINRLNSNNGCGTLTSLVTVVSQLNSGKSRYTLQPANAVKLHTPFIGLMAMPNLYNLLAYPQTYNLSLLSK